MKILRCWCSNPTGGKFFAINLPFTTKQYKVDNIDNFVSYGKTRMSSIFSGSNWGTNREMTKLTTRYRKVIKPMEWNTSLIFPVWSMSQTRVCCSLFLDHKTTWNKKSFFCWKRKWENHVLVDQLITGSMYSSTHLPLCVFFVSCPFDDFICLSSLSNVWQTCHPWNNFSCISLNTAEFFRLRSLNTTCEEVAF